MLFGPSVELSEAMAVLTIGQSSHVNIHELTYGHMFKPYRHVYGRVHGIIRVGVKLK